jgi:hypothetical protein
MLTLRVPVLNGVKGGPDQAGQLAPGGALVGLSNDL